MATEAGADTAATASDGGAEEPTVDQSKLPAEECSASIPCKTPDTFCADYSEVSGGDPDLQRLRCGPSKACDIVTCPKGKTCLVRDIIPHEVICD